MTIIPTVQIAPIVSFSFRWRRFRLAETDASDLVSAACYRRSKHVGIHAVIVAELKLGNVQWHIFGAHLVERADYAAFEDRPETFNRVGVNRTDNVLLVTVFYGLARIFLQAPIDLVLVRRQQADFIGHGLTDKLFDVLLRDVIEYAGNHIALALNRTDDGRLASSSAAALAVVALNPVAVVILAADPCFVNLDNSAKLRFRGDQRSADFVAHRMGRLVTAKAHHALDLKGAHSLLAGKHEMGDAIPVAEGLLRVLKDRAHQCRKAIAVLVTRLTEPMERLVARGVVQVSIATTRTGDTLRPAASNQVTKARFVVTDRKAVLKLADGHLRDGLRTICHGGYPLEPERRRMLPQPREIVKRQIFASAEPGAGQLPIG
jgi:hypothetical protein